MKSVRVVTVRRLNGYKVIEIWWLSGIENFLSEKNDFIFNPFRNFKPVKRFQKRNDVFEFWSLDNNFILYRPTAAIILPILNV